MFLPELWGNWIDDWQQRYGHPIHLVETFVDRSRFAGTCYRAANWMLAGQTQGRTRQDRHHQIQAPIKDIYLYGLTRSLAQAPPGTSMTIKRHQRVRT